MNMSPATELIGFPDHQAGPTVTAKCGVYVWVDQPIVTVNYMYIQFSFIQNENGTSHTHRMVLRLSQTPCSGG